MDLPETTLWWTQQQQQQPILVVEPIQNPSTSGPPFHPSWPLQHHQPTWFNSHPPGDPPLPYNPTTITPHFNLNNQNQNDDDEEEEEENDDDDNNNTSSDVQAATTTQEGAEMEDEKEAMFEKPLTPSDVGKLNRLVIPKQHAEKYFPLGASGGGDSGECKGLLLSFEDESGKCWRFRYSYWNSSQSYVLTKGWSRYVKDKSLYAGDVVLFERHRADNQRLFIGWRRRGPSGTDPAHLSKGVGHDGNSDGKNGAGVGGGGRGVGVGWTRGFYSAHPYPAHQLLPYQHDCLDAVRGSQGQNQRTRSVGNSSSSSSSSRVLRLFGVNMECQPEQHDSGTSTPQCSYDSNTMPSTQGTDTQHFYHYHQPSSHSPNPQYPHMVRHQPYYY